jgi:hypothetical protein
VKRLLTSSAALLWGLQFAFLAPVLALLLVTLYDATPADVGWVLAVYNSGGFVAALVIPAWADHTGNYLRPLLISAVLTVALAGALWTVTTLPLAVVALTVLGGPAGVGVSLLFAELRRSGADIAEVMNTRAIVSFAWVAGPPARHVHHGRVGRRRHPARDRRRRRPQRAHHGADDPTAHGGDRRAEERGRRRPHPAAAVGRRRDRRGLRAAPGHQLRRHDDHGAVRDRR